MRRFSCLVLAWYFFFYFALDKAQNYLCNFLKMLDTSPGSPRAVRAGAWRWADSGEPGASVPALPA